MRDQAVFVPIVLSAGVLFSLLAELRDVGRRLWGRHWLDRRCEVQGCATAATVLGGVPTAVPPHQCGLRSRGFYAGTAVVFGALTVWVARGSWGNFVGWTWWAKRISWLFVASLPFVVAFASITAVAATIAWRWPHPPPWTIPWLARTPLATEDPIPSLGGDRHERHADQ